MNVRDRITGIADDRSIKRVARAIPLAFRPHEPGVELDFTDLMPELGVLGVSSNHLEQRGLLRVDLTVKRVLGQAG